LNTNGDDVVSGSAQIDHDQTTNFDTNEHVDHTGVSITAGAGLTGGGDISSTRTIDIGQGDGISVTANAVAVDGTVLRDFGDNVVTGSSQIDLTQTTNYVSGIKTRLDAEGVISGSSQVSYNSISDVPSGIVSGSSQVSYTGLSNIPDGIVSGSSQLTGEFDTRYLNTGGDGVVSGSDQLSGSFVLKTGDTVTGNLVISGDLTVNGTTTYISSSAVDIGDNIINLNYGGSQTNGGIYVADATGGSTLSGSLLWDGTNDYWIGGTLGNESKILVADSDGVVSGSSQIDHDLTTNFVSDEHIAHSGVNIDSGLGLSGGGDITTTRTLTLDTGSTHFQDGVSAVSPALPDGTVSGSSQIDHDLTTNFTSSEHVDHSVVTITAGAGLTGGGNITTSRTLDVGAGDGISVLTDSIAVDGTVLRTTGDNVFTGSSQVVHDSTNGFVANEHIDHSGVSITAGSGLTGGGDITTTRTLNIGAGDGITVNADDIAVDSTVLRTGGLGVISGSSQVDLTQTTNYVSGIKTRLDAEGAISGSSQLTTEFDTRYLNTNGDSVVSGSSQLTSSLDDRYILESESGSFLQNIVEDTTPQLGGALDMQGNTISGSGNIRLLNSRNISWANDQVDDGSTRINGADSGGGSSVIGDINATGNISASVINASSIDVGGTGNSLLLDNGATVVSSSFVKTNVANTFTALQTFQTSTDLQDDVLIGEGLLFTPVDQTSNNIFRQKFGVDSNQYWYFDSVTSSLAPEAKFNFTTITADRTYGIYDRDGNLLVTTGSGTQLFLDDGTLINTSSLGGGGGISNVVEDTTPQLGGALDTNGFAIGTSLTDSHVITGSLTLRVSGSTVFDILGSQGQLFSITDDLTGDIFGVGDISGDSILNVNSAGVVTINDTLEITGSLIISGGIGQNALLDDGTLVATSSLGSGNVSSTGTPVNNQLAVWTDSTTIEGEADVTYDGTTLRVAAGDYTASMQPNSAGFDMRVNASAGGWGRGFSISDDTDTQWYQIGHAGSGQTWNYAFFGETVMQELGMDLRILQNQYKENFLMLEMIYL
jgi:hypothetical protein